nr:putative ribonuclease H-like domain-containing protein [Tanacetum cinerariifolium]
WFLKNKKDERGIVIRNKARIVAQGYTHEEGIYYNEVFAPVAPRAWYGTLSKFLLDNGFQRRTIDQTLFIRKHKGEFLLVQVYVDDIIFGSSNPQLCREFEALMHNKFQMSAMGELTFFLGLWYPKESPFDLVAYSYNNYGGATQDRKSATRGCQFLGRRLLS